MANITKAIDVNVPVEVIFNFVANPRNSLKYIADFTKFEPVGEPEYGLGAKVLAAGTFMGVEYQARLEIVEFVPDQKFVTRSSGGVKGFSTWEFRALSENVTEVTFTSAYQLPGSVLGWMFDKLMVEKAVEKNTIQTLVNLKRIMENRPRLRAA